MVTTCEEFTQAVMEAYPESADDDGYFHCCKGCVKKRLREIGATVAGERIIAKGRTLEEMMARFMERPATS